MITPKPARMIAALVLLAITGCGRTAAVPAPVVAAEPSAPIAKEQPPAEPVKLLPVAHPVFRADPSVLERALVACGFSFVEHEDEEDKTIRWRDSQLEKRYVKLLFDRDKLRRVTLLIAATNYSDAEAELISKTYEAIVLKLIDSPLEAKQAAEWMTIVLTMRDAERDISKLSELQQLTHTILSTKLATVKIESGGSIRKGVVYFDFEPYDGN